MTAKGPIEIRLELAEGHWTLGEYDDALTCLERIDAAPDRVRSVAERLLAATPSAEAAERLRELLAHQGAPGAALATPTMAVLLEKQGQTEKAVLVARDALRRNPDDPRTRALLDRLSPENTAEAARVATLERWLGYFAERKERESRP